METQLLSQYTLNMVDDNSKNCCVSSL